jgi:hypothetical protein
MNKNIWNAIATTPLNEHSYDKYIDLESLGSDGQFGQDTYDLGMHRFFTSRGSVRKLIGTSAKVEKDIVRNGEKLDCEVREMFLSPSREMYLPKSKVFPNEGWLPYSTAKALIQGLPSDHMSESDYDAPNGKNDGVVKGSMCGREGICARTCISMTGNLTLNSSLRSRYLKSWFWRTQPLAFLRLLIHEIKEICRLSKADKVYFRLNGTSDIWWEHYLRMDPIVADVPKLGGFNDYTKFSVADRMTVWFPRSYRITFSVDEKPKSLTWAKQWMLLGHGCSIVCESVKKKKPDNILALINDYTEVIDGDLDDARFADAPGSMILLRNKGPLKVESCKVKKNGSQKGLIMPSQNIIRFAQSQYRAGI